MVPEAEKASTERPDFSGRLERPERPEPGGEPGRVSRYRLRRQQRLRKTREFDRVYAQRQRAGDRHLLLFAAPNDCGQTRFGVSVSKKHGSAVRRNRLKRLLREAFRLSQHDLPRGLDLILIPRQNSGAGLDDYRRSLVRLAHKLSGRFSQDHQQRTSRGESERGT